MTIQELLLDGINVDIRHIHANKHTQNIYIFVKYICEKHTNTYRNTQIYTNTYLHSHTNICIFIQMHTYIHTSVNTITYKYKHTPTHIHTLSTEKDYKHTTLTFSETIK